MGACACQDAVNTDLVPWIPLSIMIGIIGTISIIARYGQGMDREFLWNSNRMCQSALPVGAETFPTKSMPKHFRPKVWKHWS